MAFPFVGGLGVEAGAARAMIATAISSHTSASAFE